MVAEKYRIPPRSVFDRYSPAIRFRLITGYHRKLTEKHRWYVRTLNDYFYCDGERPDIPGAEIFDCDWMPCEWNTRPYRHFYNPVQKTWYKSYAKRGLPELREYGYGYTREDSMVMRGDEITFMQMTESGVTVWWTPQDTRLFYVNVSGFITEIGEDGSVKQGTISHLNEIKNPNLDPVIRALKMMNTKKYEGFYADLYETLRTTVGLSKSRL